MNVIAECERCGNSWLIKTDVAVGLLEGICVECQADSDVEKPLTFRAPTDNELQTMTVEPHGLNTD